jgi:hypothetical protein
MAPVKDKADALVVKRNEAFAAALAVNPSFAEDDVRGKEAISTDDLRLPQFGVVQNTSPQKDETKSEYIEGIREGELFDNLTNTNYGKGPLTFTVFRLHKNAMEFDKDRNVVDFNVPWDDTRCEFTAGEGGERVKPRATRFYNFFVYVHEAGIPGVLRFSSTKVPVALRLIQLLALRPGPFWAGSFKLGVVRESNAKGTFFNYKVDLAGPTPDEIVKLCSSYYETYKPEKVVIVGGDREEDQQPGKDDIPF